MRFLDREEELNRLDKLFDSDEGSLACLYGRRRCGKTHLLRESTGNRTNVFYHLADKSDKPAQIARFVGEVSAQIPAFRAVSAADWGSVLDLWMGLAPRGSILVFDEFPYLVQRDESLPSILQRICDVLPESGKKVVICGSSQRMMQGFVLKQSEPLYGRAREIMPILPLPFEWMAKAFPSWTPFKRLKAWAVWGGVPRYWDLQMSSDTLWDAVWRNVCSPLGALRNEPQFLLLDDFGDVAQASSVLSFIGNGAHRAGEIAARMGRPATDMTRPLQRLAELGLVAKDTPFGADGNGKKSFYRIIDPFLDFWYRFVQPNLSRQDFLERPEERVRFEQPFSAYLGEVWERLVRETLAKRGLLDVGMVRNVARWWGTGTNKTQMELDVVAETEDGETLLVGEAKLRLSEIEREHAKSELETKARLLPFAGRYRRITTRLFVAADTDKEGLGLSWLEERGQ